MNAQMLKLAKKIIVTQHAQDQMEARNITIADVAQILKGGVIWEAKGKYEGTYNIRENGSDLFACFKIANGELVILTVVRDLRNTTVGHGG